MQVIGRGVLTAPRPGKHVGIGAVRTPRPTFELMIQMNSPQRLRFGRGSRIKQGRDFAKVRQQGERMTTGCLIANWRQLPPGSGSRLGVITAGKIGNAVARNRARRLLRESFRLHQNDLAQPIDLVLVARPSIAGKAFAEVERDFLTTLRKTGLLRGS